MINISEVYMKTRKSNKITQLLISAVAVFALAMSIFAPAARSAVAYYSSIATSTTIANTDFESALSAGWEIAAGSSENATAEIDNKTFHNGTSSLKISATEAAKYGIKTTSTLTLSANRYYILSVWAKATEASTPFSFGLSGGIDEMLSNSATTDWAKYLMYIETSTASDVTVYVELWLGNKTSTAAGTVFFDDVDIIEIDHAQYLKAKSENAAICFSKISLYDSANTDAQLFNGDESRKWQTAVESGVSIENYVFEFETESDPSSITRKVIKIDNSDENSESIILSSQNFTLAKMGLYRVSIFAKTVKDGETDTTASFVVKLSDGTRAAKQTVSSLSSSSTNNYFNDFTEYEFYVRTGCLSSETLTLSIEVKSGSAIYLDNVKVENTLLAKFKNASKKLDYLTSSNETITNGQRCRRMVKG